MNKSLNMLAVDYGASSGRAVIGQFDGSRLDVREIHRFTNDPVQLRSSFYWDFPRLFLELKNSIRRFHVEAAGETTSLAVDTWGVDFGLLDRNGDLLGNPYHYRDARTDGIMESAFAYLPKEQLYAKTGIQVMQINTIFQLYAMQQEQSPLLQSAKHLLFMPDLLQYFLTGVKAAEYSIASTSGLLNPYTKTWSKEVQDTLSIPSSLFSPIVMPGHSLGSLSKPIQEELQVGEMKVINTASHDTASAVVSVPAEHSSYAYISTGTWSLMGVESDEPIINQQIEQLAFTNEGGAAGKIRFLKNIMGLWLIQECKRHWETEGSKLSYAEMQTMAGHEVGFKSYVNPSSDLFLAPGNMPHRIQSFCKASGQSVPENKSQILRCILDSLALKYRQTLDELETILARPLEVIHMVGGGIQNELLCQLTANASGKRVYAGPIEATSIGNLLVQAMSHGEISSISEARQVVRNSFPPKLYTPVEREQWETAYETFKMIINK